MSNDLSLYSWSRAISQKAIAGAGLHLQWHFSVIGLIKLQDLKLIFISLSVFLCLSLSTLLYLPFSIAFISFSYNCTIRLKQFRFFFFSCVCVFVSQAYGLDKWSKCNSIRYCPQACSVPASLHRTYLSYITHRN